MAVRVDRHTLTDSQQTLILKCLTLQPKERFVPYGRHHNRFSIPQTKDPIKFFLLPDSDHLLLPYTFYRELTHNSSR